MEARMHEEGRQGRSGQGTKCIAKLYYNDGHRKSEAIKSAGRHIAFVAPFQDGKPAGSQTSRQAGNSHSGLKKHTPACLDA